VSEVLATLWRARFVLLEGLRVTCVVSAGGLALGLAIGCAGAVAAGFGPRWLRLAVAGWVTLLRGVPVLVTLFFLYYGVAALGQPMSAVMAAALALAFFAGAQLTEVGRGALASVPRGIAEAGRALGMTTRTLILAVLAPLAIRRALPSTANVAVQLVKASTLASALGAGELLLSSQQVAARTLLIPQVYVLVWAVYVAVNLVLAGIGRWLERRWRHARA
jgi:polar amino acid transport system permease protein